MKDPRNRERLVHVSPYSRNAPRAKTIDQSRILKIPHLALPYWKDLARRALFNYGALRKLPQWQDLLAGHATRCGENETAFHRKFERHFRAHFGHTLAYFLRKWRAEAARAFLRRTGARTKEVAARFHYSDSSHLSRDFREFFNRTPRSFAEERRKGVAAGAPGGVVFIPTIAIAQPACGMIEGKQSRCHEPS